MSDRNNPQAFPDSSHGPDGTGFSEEGMSLRDYFAGQIIAGIDLGDLEVPNYEEIAFRAYQVAEAMLTERKL